ncbi:unnamed protein product [Orchesella dallaii]|uniref:Cytochrome P450 n=1 Tax=Orchesella dallaii TaxID=48710 RepID=A0ABP1S0R6_9HEXA
MDTSLRWELSSIFQQIYKIANDKPSYLVGVLASLVFIKFLSKLIFPKDNNRIYGLEVIPGPKVFPFTFFASAIHFLPFKDTLVKSLAWNKKFGPILQTNGLGHTTLVIFSAEITEAFLKNGDLAYISKKGMPFYDMMRPLLGTGLLISEGPLWQFRRKLMIKSMSFNNLQRYTQLLNRHSKRFVNSLEKVFSDTKEHQIDNLINTSFLSIILEILTGNDVQHDNEEVVEYHHNFQKWKDSLLERINTPWCMLDFPWRFYQMYHDHNVIVSDMNGFAKRV